MLHMYILIRNDKDHLNAPHIHKGSECAELAFAVGPLYHSLNAPFVYFRLIVPEVEVYGHWILWQDHVAKDKSNQNTTGTVTRHQKDHCGTVQFINHGPSQADVASASLEALHRAEAGAADSGEHPMGSKRPECSQDPTKMFQTFMLTNCQMMINISSISLLNTKHLSLTIIYSEMISEGARDDGSSRSRRRCGDQGAERERKTQPRYVNIIMRRIPL